MLNGEKVVALCISRISDEANHEYVISLNNELRKSGYNLFVYATCADLFWNTPGEEGEAKVFDLINYDITDAIIIYDEKIYNKNCIKSVIRKAEAADVPVITIGGYYEGCINIKFDYEYGFEQVVRHVTDVHGCEKLHFMAGIKGNEFSEKRLDVFKKVLEEKNILFYDDMVSYGDFWTVPTENATQKLIESNNIPEAIICANDTMALTVSAVLRKNGIEVPDDVIVTGFDGIETIHFSIPKITSCKCSYEDIAIGCADIIDSLFSGERTDTAVYITPRLIPYESCGCIFSSNINVSEYINSMNNKFNRFQAENRALSEISEKIQICSQISEIPEQIAYNVIYDMCCLLNTECIDESINPLTALDKSGNDEEMFVLFDTDYSTDFKQSKIKKSEIIPNLSALMSYKIPIIFVALNFLGFPLGYACFHFHNSEIDNYYKIPQTVSALNNAIGGFRNMRYQQYLNRQIEAMYLTDSLTGLYNRNGFLKQYNNLIENISGEKVTIVITDLDGLKPINDTYGHSAGDNAIQIAAFALKSACPEDAICMRFGGDEMVAVIRGEYPEAEIRRKVESYLNRYNDSSDKPYKVSVSVGVYASDISDKTEFEELVKKSDKLMYAEKMKKHNKSI